MAAESSATGASDARDASGALTQPAPTGYIGQWQHFAWSDPTAWPDPRVLPEPVLPGEDDHRRLWWQAIAWVAAGAATAALGAGVTFAIRPHVIHDDQQQRATAPVQDAPAPPPSTAAAPPTSTAPPPALPMTQDDQFVDLVETGLEPNGRVVSTEKIIALGHWECRYLAKGHTIPDAIDDLIQTEHFASGAFFTPDAARVVVNASVKIYCPQFGVPA